MIQTILVTKPSDKLQKAIANETSKGNDGGGSPERDIEDILKDSEQVQDSGVRHD